MLTHGQHVGAGYSSWPQGVGSTSWSPMHREQASSPGIPSTHAWGHDNEAHHGKAGLPLAVKPISPNTCPPPCPQDWESTCSGKRVKQRSRRKLEARLHLRLRLRLHASGRRGDAYGFSCGAAAQRWMALRLLRWQRDRQLL